METLSSKVSELGEITITLRRYMEAIIEKVSPQESGDLIEAENKRLKQAQIYDALKRNRFFEACLLPIGATFEELKDILEKATSLQDFVTRVGELADAKKLLNMIEELLAKPGAPLNDLNEARKIAGKEEFKEKGLIG